MHRPIVFLLVVLFGAGSIDAQSGGTEPSATVRFDELDAEFRKVWRAWRTKSFDARKNGASDDELVAIEAADPTKSYIPRFQKGAEKYAGTEEAIEFLSWIQSWAWRHERPAAMAALDQLIRDHLEHPRMVRIAFSLALKAKRNGFPRKKALDTQDLIAAKAATPEAKAEVLYHRAYLIAGTKSNADEKERAARDLATAMTSGDARIKKRAEGLLFEMNRLQVGMVAPEIEGEDLDGVSFKLADYRGKVVFLDFWGDW